MLRHIRKQQREIAVASKGSHRSASSMASYTIPKATAPPERVRAPASTFYQPNFESVRSHSSMAALVPLREPAKRDPTSDPGSFLGKPLPQPKLYVSTLSRAGQSRRAASSSSPDFLLTPRGLGSRVGWKAPGGTISHTKRFPPSQAVPPAPSVIDVPPPRHESRGISFGAGPLVRGDVTKVRPFASEPSSKSSFDRCRIPELSFTAARKATSIIQRDCDDYGTIDDPQLREDERFLKEVREDLHRWSLKQKLT